MVTTEGEAIKFCLAVVAKTEASWNNNNNDGLTDTSERPPCLHALAVKHACRRGEMVLVSMRTTMAIFIVKSL